MPLFEKPEEDYRPTVWMCYASFRWAHAPLHRCSKPSHPNCGWTRLDKEAADPPKEEI